jgi:U3 small nucleolar RNA-associated protein 10
LLSPYIGTLLPHIQDDLLPAFANGSLADLPLWTLLHQTLSKSFEVDDGAFWTDESLLKLIPLLISQLPLFPQSPTEPSAPIQALSSLAAASASEALLKSLNTSICLSMRSDDARTRLVGVKALDGIWAAQSEGLLPFVPETVSEFLGELLEDENADVEAGARKLLGRIEGLTGSLKEYLE